MSESIKSSGANATLGMGWVPPVVVAPGRYYRPVKRAVDLAVSLMALAAISPLFALIALLIKLDSRGPVLFLQQRVGYDPRTGKPRVFNCYKFRSMQHRADPAVHREHVARLIRENAGVAEAGGSLKLAHDRRITRMGRILRKVSLDELPQLINVVIGDMSLVGPRPALPYEVELYQDWHRRRLSALPGITGWWQVRGRNQVCFDEAVRMDIYYVEHQSVMLDLKILLLTPAAVISGKGAG